MGSFLFEAFPWSHMVMLSTLIQNISIKYPEVSRGISNRYRETSLFFYKLTVGKTTVAIVFASARADAVLHFITKFTLDKIFGPAHC